MDFDQMLAVAKASQQVTLAMQTAQLTKLQAITNVDYSATISAIATLNSAISALSSS